MKKVNTNKYDISSIKRVTLKFHVVVMQNNGKEMYKKGWCTCKVAFLLIRHIVFVFHRSPALPSPLSITRVYIYFFEQTMSIIESFAFSPGRLNLYIIKGSVDLCGRFCPALPSMG